MAVPNWFDYKAYFNNKLAALGNGWDALSLKAAFEDAGYAYDADGMYQHFMDFGNAEGVSPNSWFNAGEYLYNKAAQYYNTSSVTPNHVTSMAKAMEGAGMSPWDHFHTYWAEYYADRGEFLNPSAGFDVAKYMNDKLAMLQKGDPAYTMDDLVKAFTDADLDPVQHYEAFGKDEGLTISGSAGTGATVAVGADPVWGTNANDYFTAKPGVLSDDTYIDGLGGTDTLYADIKVNGDTISPEISNVETVLFRAQKADGTKVDNLTDAEIDAEHISGMKVLGSENSRDTLKVEDVRIDSTDLTVRFSNSDPGKVGFEVYFDPQHLKAEKSQTSGTLIAQLIDTVGALPVASGGQDNPLWDNPYTGITFSLNGKDYTLDFGSYNNNSDPTPTYEEFVAQIQAAIGADPALSGLGLQVSVGDEFDARVGIGEYKGTIVTGKQILIRTDQGELEGKAWIAANGLPATNSTSATFDDDVSTTCPLIQTNVELDNVGRVQWDDASPCLPDNSIYGSQAGDLVIGSMAGRGGVERFDVTVDQGSWLSSMSSTNNALRMVTVKNGAIYGDNDNGNLFIGRSVEAEAKSLTQTVKDALDLLQQNAPITGALEDMLKDVAEGGIEALAKHLPPELAEQLRGTDLGLAHWMDVPRLLATDGLTDVKYFDASAMNGKVNIGAQITEAAYDKYLKDVDGVDDMAQGYAPNGPFKYLLGNNDDTLNMTVAGGVAADTDFRMNIDAGAGNDLVNFSFNFADKDDGPFLNQLENQMSLKNVSVDLGAGDDTFYFWGDGAMDVSDGAGNDALYVGQNAPKLPLLYMATPLAPVGNSSAMDKDDYNAVWVFNVDEANDPKQTAIFVGPDGAQSLDNDLRGTTTAFNYTGAGEEGADYLKVTVSFKGITSTVTMTTALAAAGEDGAGTISAADVNHLIIEAINEDATLGKLLNAKDGAGSSLLVEALYNGKMALDDLKISFSTVKADGKDSGVQFGEQGENILNNRYDTDGNAPKYANFASNTLEEGFFEGSNTGTNSATTIHMGLGNDVIALNAADGTGTNNPSNDTLVLNGAFGHDVVMNFTTAKDKINVEGFTASHVDTSTGAAIDVRAANFGLTGTDISATAGTSLLVLKNSATAENDYWFFEVNSSTGSQLAAEDKITLLGSITLGVGDTLVDGDIHLV